MKKKSDSNAAKMQRKYDFSGATRGKYARRYRGGTNVVVLEPDVARAFPTADAVNSSLRALAEITRMRQTAAAK